MRVYIATRLERAADHRLVRDALAALGHQLTYDWTIHGSVWADGHDKIRQVAAAELEGVTSADLVIVLLPGGRGTHTELGAAIAAGRPVLAHTTEPRLIEGPETCAFYHHPLVRLQTGPLVNVPALADCMLRLMEGAGCSP